MVDLRGLLKNRLSGAVSLVKIQVSLFDKQKYKHLFSYLVVESELVCKIVCMHLITIHKPLFKYCLPCKNTVNMARGAFNIILLNTSVIKSL